MNNELYHHGVKGMRWGVRRYQPYPNGSMRKSHHKKGTIIKKNNKPIKKQLGIGGKHSGDPAELEQNIKGGKDKPNVSPAEKTAKETEKMFRSGSDISRRLGTMNKNRKYKPEDLSKVSDQELRNRINRIEMERRYNTLRYEQTKSGYDTATNILDTVGDVAAISASVASVAAIAYGMGVGKKGKH